LSHFDTQSRLVDEHEAAARLGLSVKTLRRWRWAKRGPAWSKIGAAVRYAPADLAAFIAAGRQTTNTDEAA
jgi:predicted DNA-binding transcriptional regulator AlpA